MPELIERLVDLIVRKLQDNQNLETTQLVSELKSEIEADPEFAALLQANDIMIQMGQRDTHAFQTVVNGGIAYIGTNHHNIDSKKIEDIFTKLIQTILSTNKPSIVLAHQPPDTSDFQGRQQEIQQLQGEVEQKRLVGIIGAGGYGKSTLAAYCYKEASRFEDKLWITFNEPYNFKYFSLGLLRELGQTVNENTDSHSLVNKLINNLYPRKFLLVLDNLESLLDDQRQFIDQGYQDFLLRWLEGENHSTLLFTSRELLTILETHHDDIKYHWFSLGGLSNDSGIELLKNHRIIGEPRDLQQFVKAADGHPLLLKLAAKCLKTNGNADVEHTLSQADLDKFTQSICTHQENKIDIHNIHLLLKASMERLAPKLKELWLNLSVYEYRSIDLGAAQAVTTESIDEQDLRELAERYLLEEQNGEESGTYSFLKLVKDFAQQQFAQQQADIKTEVRKKAIEYCRSVAMPSGWDDQEVLCAAHYRQMLKPPNWKNEGDIIEYLEIFYHYYELKEYANAFDCLWSTGCDIFLELRGYNSIRVELYTKLKSFWEAKLSSAEQRNIQKQKLFAQMLDCLGAAYRCLGQYQDAIDSHQQALKLFSKIGICDREKAVSLRNLGKVYFAQGIYAKSLDTFEEARQISRKINDVLGELLSSQDVIDTDSAQGNHERNIERYQELIKRCQQYSYLIDEATSWKKLALTYKKLGRYQESFRAFRKARHIFRSIRDKFTQQQFRSIQAELLRNLGEAYESFSRLQDNSPNYRRSRKARQIAVNLHQQVLQLSDNQLETAYALCRLGWDLLYAEQSEEAIEKFNQALTIFQALSNLAGEATALNYLGLAHCNLKNYHQAEGYYNEALNIHTHLQDPDGKAVVLNNLGLIYEQKGDVFRFLATPIEAEHNNLLVHNLEPPGLDLYRQAFNSYQQSLEIINELPDRDLANDARTRRNLGSVGNKLGQDYYNLRQYQQAYQFYQQALQAFEEINDNFHRDQTISQGKAEALRGLGNVCNFLGQYLDAVDWQQQTLEISRQLGDLLGEAEALLGLGNTYYSLGNYKEPEGENALQSYQEALTIFRELDNKLGKARVKLGLGKTYHSLGQCNDAIGYLKPGGA